jgi:hypothetical protein
VGNPKTKCAPFVCRTSKWWTLGRVYCWVYRITCHEGVKQSGKAQTPASSLKGLWISELHCQTIHLWQGVGGKGCHFPGTWMDTWTPW